MIRYIIYNETVNYECKETKNKEIHLICDEIYYERPCNTS